MEVGKVVDGVAIRARRVSVSRVSVSRIWVSSVLDVLRRESILA